MPSLWESQAIAALVTADLLGDDLQVGPEPAYLGVWPVAQSGGPRAEGVMIRAEAGIRLSMNAVPNTIGPNSAFLASGTEYVFPLHPAVNTLGFLHDGSSSTQVRVRWFIIR